MNQVINWDATFFIVRQNEQAIQAKIEEVKNKVIEMQKTAPYIGLVYTKLEQDIKLNRFMVWIDKGVTVQHKFIHFENVDISPLHLQEEKTISLKK
jgi:hypothetical protein